MLANSIRYVHCSNGIIALARSPSHHPLTFSLFDSLLSAPPCFTSTPKQPRSAHARTQFIVQAAKKKGGGGGGNNKQKKSAGSLATPPKPQLKPYLSTPVIMQNLLLIESYYRKVGKPLFEQEVEISDVAQVLWDCPYPVLAHDAATEDPGPIFVYANKAGLDLFEAEWEHLIGTPSTKSAEPITDIQEDRAAALASAMQNGYIDDYEGNRISFKGTKFRISGATLFNVEAPSGERVGQAVVIRGWEYEDGRKGGDLAAKEEEESKEGEEEGAPTEEEVTAAEGAVAA